MQLKRNNCNNRRHQTQQIFTKEVWSAEFLRRGTMHVTTGGNDRFRRSEICKKKSIMKISF